MYRVLLIDDERLALASLRRRIPWESCGFTVCGQACSAREGLEKIRELQPELVFTDIRIPGVSGLDLIQQAGTEFPQVRFVVISGYSEFEYAKRVIEYGVLGFCVKPFDEEEIKILLGNIRRQLDARIPTAPAVSSAAFRPGDSPQRVDRELADLGISPETPKWVLELLGDEPVPQIQGDSQTRWWALPAAGGRCFLLAGAAAADDAARIFSGCSGVVRSGVSGPFFSGEELERAALEARVAAYGYFFGHPGFHRFQGRMESPELPELLRALAAEVARVLCQSAAALSESDSRSAVMRKILLYVNEHYDNPELGVGKISEIFGFNQNYVSQMFKKSEQEGFTAYLTQVRMGHAIQLLRESGCQIREVGERCGYADYFYFARVFKKYTGRSPGEYRGEPRGNEGEES